MQTSYSIKSGIGALCLSFLWSVNAAAGDKANEKKQIIPQNPVLKSTKIKKPPTPNWNSLGNYFIPAFQRHDKKTLDIYASPERFKSLSERFDEIEKKYKIDASKMCIPAAESWDLAISPEAMKLANLSQEQEITVAMIDYMIDTKMGLDILGDAAYSNDVVICAINGDAQTLSKGFYDKALKLVSFNLHVREYDADKNKFVTRDATKTIFNDPKDFGDALHILSEELAHAFQQYKGIDVAPIVAKNNLYSARPDEKIWSLMVEAHAKVIAANILVHIAMGEKQKDGTYNKGYSSVLNHFTQNYEDIENASIVRQVLQAHMRHGHEKIKNDPSLLWPAYKAFFTDGGAQLYYESKCEIINQNIDPKDYDNIDIKSFIDAFGQIPTMKGNALEKPLSGKNLEDIAALLPNETNLKNWLQDAQQAKRERKIIPDLATGKREACESKSGLTLPAPQ